MKVIPEELEFEWDKGNLNKSRRKHGIATQEAESVFLDKMQRKEVEKYEKIKENI